MTEAPFDREAFLKTLPPRPGVYRMLGEDDDVLYVGKARNLQEPRDELLSRACARRPHAGDARQVRRIEVTVTASETEALLLEYNLIKRHRPRYNVAAQGRQELPVHSPVDAPSSHGCRSIAARAACAGRCFGPYPSAVATRETLLLLQKLFRVRPCEDTFFANRSRPCLQYQIERCSGPCVGLVTEEAYAQDVADAVQVLEGRNDEP